jgi:hypothetical protein
MSELGLPAENGKNAGEGQSGEQPPEHDWREYFRFRPVAFSKAVLAKADHYHRKHKERDYIEYLLRRAWLAVRQHWLGFAIKAAIIVAVGYLLHAVGLFEANTIIALFTIVLAIAAWLQWWTYRLQWQAMQGQLEHAVRATEQADSNMRSEQRAWIATTITTHGPLSREYEEQVEMDFPIIIRNEGRSPAVITHAFVQFDTAFKTDLNNLERLARQQPEIRTWLAPQDMFAFNARDYAFPKMIPKCKGEQIEAGHLEAYLSGAFIYKDAFGEEHKTLCTYEYNKGFGSHPIDGNMT